jgi:hypothetical protein
MPRATPWGRASGIGEHSKVSSFSPLGFSQWCRLVSKNVDPGALSKVDASRIGAMRCEQETAQYSGFFLAHEILRALFIP